MTSSIRPVEDLVEKLKPIVKTWPNDNRYDNVAETIRHILDEFWDEFAPALTTTLKTRDEEARKSFIHELAQLSNKLETTDIRFILAEALNPKQDD